MNRQSGLEAPNAEIEIDLRPYIMALIRHWWIMLVLGVICLLMVLIYSASRDNRYVAAANVSILQLRSQVSFDPQFTTESSVLRPNDNNRTTALAALADSQALIAKVYNTAKQTAQTNEFTLGKLDSNLKGDLLVLSVEHPDPEMAAMIANVWAVELTESANQAYVSTGSTLDEARQSADAAFGDYAVAADILDTFIGSSDLQNLQIEYEYVTQVLSTTQHTLAVQTKAVVRKQIEEQFTQYFFWSERTKVLEVAQLELTALRNQLEADVPLQSTVIGKNAGRVLAESGIDDLQISTIDLNLGELLLGLSNASEVDTSVLDILPSLDLEDVERTLDATNNELAFARVQLEALKTSLIVSKEISIDTAADSSNELVADSIDVTDGEQILVVPSDSAEYNLIPLNQDLDQLAEYHNELAAAMSKLQSEEQVLIKNRDSAWQLYVTIDNKAREVQAQLATGSPQARIATEASEPFQAVQLEPLVAGPTAVLFGIIVGFILIIGREFVLRLRDSQSQPKEQPGRSEMMPVGTD